MKARSTWWRWACALLLAPVLFAVGRASAADGEERAPVVRVHAAASLTEVVSELAGRLDDVRVIASFGATSVLARQVVDGAPADVFLSASPTWTRYLVARGRVDGAPVVFARNRLVAIAPAGSPLAARAVDGPAALLDALPEGGRIAIADAGVPAGEYARAALEHLGLAGTARGRLVGQADVRAVLRSVAAGELDAGFVYATDAERAEVAVLFAFDPATHPPIEYRAALLADARDPAAARAFLERLRGEAGRAVLTRAGFAVDPDPAQMRMEPPSKSGTVMEKVSP